MTKLEIIANRVLEDDIIEILELHELGENFTYFMPVYGRGRHGRKEGSAIWPEENIFMIVYVEDEKTETLINDLQKVKRAFPNEGMRCYISGNQIKRL